MAIILENAILVDYDPVQAEPGALRMEGEIITERAESVTCHNGDEILDCEGAVVLPGLVNGHTHLYAVLGVGMPPPPRSSTGQQDALEPVWWRLDHALVPEAIVASARVGALDALRCGVTTLIDHHSSPNAIDGSLDLLEEGIGDVGLRAVLCYETTDRNGPQACQAALAENRRYLHKCASRNDGRFAALAGAHASFTCSDETLGELARIAAESGAGVHLHLAEDPLDAHLSLERYGSTPVERLVRFGMLGAGSILAGGTHLSGEALDTLNTTRAPVAHCPRSNMHNAVGYAPVTRLKGPVLLGTDGVNSDLWGEARTAWFKLCESNVGLAPEFVVEMLAAAARQASLLLGVVLGRLQVGTAADVVVTDYRPATPLQTTNAASHLIYAMGAQHVESVLVRGHWLLRDRVVWSCDEHQARISAADAARTLWDQLTPAG